MSNFDNGLSVGIILGKKLGGTGPCPPCECVGLQAIEYELDEKTEIKTPTETRTVPRPSTEFEYEIGDV